MVLVFNSNVYHVEVFDMIKLYLDGKYNITKMTLNSVNFEVHLLDIPDEFNTQDEFYEFISMQISLMNLRREISTRSMDLKNLIVGRALFQSCIEIPDKA